VRSKPILGVAVVMTCVAVVGILLPRVIPAAERDSSQEAAQAEKVRGKRQAIAVDVVIEEIDFTGNTITARATEYVIPPHDNVGGIMFRTGTTDGHKDKATRFVRLPVMPEAELKNKNVKTGLHAILRLEMLPRGPLVVVGIDEYRGPERIGVESVDAVGTGRK